MKPVHKVIAGVIAATSALAASQSQAQMYRSEQLRSYEYRQQAALGVVESIETVKGTQQGNKVAGTILGGIIGGVVGHQFGSGRGNDVATVAGALGGAAVGHNLGENKGSRDSYRVTVRMDDGDTRIVQQDGLYDLRHGDRVRVDGDRVTLYAGDRYDQAPADAYVPPEVRQGIYQAGDGQAAERTEYRAGDRQEFVPQYQPAPRPEYRPDNRGYRYQRDLDDDDSGYRYRP